MYEQITTGEKRANARGFINQIVTATGANTKQAMDLFTASNNKADRVIKRASIIRSSILEAVGQTKQASAINGLPANLAGALRSY